MLFIVDSSPPLLIVDRSLICKQITVSENYGLLLIRASEKGKDSYVYVIKLDALRSFMRHDKPFDKIALKDNRVDHTKSKKK